MRAAFAKRYYWLADDRRIGWTTLYGSIWYLLDGNTVLIFSQPEKQKVRDLTKNARVTLALDETEQGEDVVIVEGTAELVENADINATLPAYVEKYGAMMKDMNSSPESIALISLLKSGYSYEIQKLGVTEM